MTLRSATHAKTGAKAGARAIAIILGCAALLAFTAPARAASADDSAPRKKAPSSKSKSTKSGAKRTRSSAPQVTRRRGDAEETIAARPQTTSAPVQAARVSAARTHGQVVQVSTSRVFVNAGAREGLRVGLSIELHRGTSLVGHCAIDRVADHSASCHGAAARAGDRFALGPPPPGPRVNELAALVDSSEQLRRRRVMEAAPLTGVEFTGSDPLARSSAPRMFFRAAQLIWAATDASAWLGQRLDVRVIGAQLTDGKGFLPATTLSLDITLLHLSRPDVATYRPGADVQLFVWEAALASHSREGNTFAIGRVLPWYAPGATRLDGAQLGRRFTPGFELGIFGGGVPDSGTLEPTFSRATAGAYWALDHSGTHSDLFPYANTTGRLAWVQSPEAGTRVELESSSIVQLRRLGDVAASFRFGLGDTMGPGGLDAVRVSFALRPTDRLSFNGSLRYSGATLLEDTALAVASGPSLHVDLSGAWEVRHALLLGVEGGVAQDDTANASFGRSWFGPTLSMPRFFGDNGGLSLGLHVEEGDLPGYSSWIGTTLFPGKRIQLLVRATLQIDSRTEGRDVTAGIYSSIHAQLFNHFALQCAVQARMQPVALGNIPPDLMGGLFADLGARGEF